MTAVTWQLIEDLPSNWPDLASSDLSALREAWRESHENLAEQDILNEFHERLAREWAIETGILERVYDIDRGTTLLLIERGLETSLIPHGATDKPAEEVVAVLRDHREALESLFDFVKSTRNLSTAYIKELHQLLLRNQKTTLARDALTNALKEVDVLKGDWKQLPNNPSGTDGLILHAYCPPEHVPSEMDRLTGMHEEHSVQDMPPEIEAAWLHHRFTQIHPFQDGNGRVARALASLVLIKEGCFPLVVSRDLRNEYIDALEAADHGELKHLVQLFAQIQVKVFRRALSLSDEVLANHERAREFEVIDSALQRLRARQQQARAEKAHVFALSDELAGISLSKVEGIAAKLDQDLKIVSNSFLANAKRSTPDLAYWYTNDVVELAKKQDYFADTRTHHSWVRLRIKEQRQAELVISFHCLGNRFSGIMATSAFMLFRSKEEKPPRIDGPYLVTPNIFQFTHKDTVDAIRHVFEQWLNEAIVLGLEQWRKQI